VHGTLEIRVLYYDALTIGPHFMWFQKADMNELNNRLLLYITLQSQCTYYETTKYNNARVCMSTCN